MFVTLAGQIVAKLVLRYIVRGYYTKLTPLSKIERIDQNIPQQ